MIRSLFFFMLLLPSVGFTQSFINKSKKLVKKELIKKEASLLTEKNTITENDTTLILTIEKPNNLPTEFIYHFDKNGRCKEEKIISNCDSCLEKVLNKVISLEKYHWKKINENQYVSDFDSKLMIELPPENRNYSLSILKMNWTRQLYDLLMNNE